MKAGHFILSDQRESCCVDCFRALTFGRRYGDELTEEPAMATLQRSL
jgi:hypothetical protein